MILTDHLPIVARHAVEELRVRSKHASVPGNAHVVVRREEGGFDRAKEAASSRDIVRLVGSARELNVVAIGLIASPRIKGVSRILRG